MRGDETSLAWPAGRRKEGPEVRDGEGKERRGDACSDAERRGINGRAGMARERETMAIVRR